MLSSWPDMKLLGPWNTIFLRHPEVGLSEIMRLEIVTYEGWQNMILTEAKPPRNWIMQTLFGSVLQCQQPFETFLDLENPAQNPAQGLEPP